MATPSSSPTSTSRSSIDSERINITPFAFSGLIKPRQGGLMNKMHCPAVCTPEKLSREGFAAFGRHHAQVRVGLYENCNRSNYRRRHRLCRRLLRKVHFRCLSSHEQSHPGRTLRWLVRRNNSIWKILTPPVVLLALRSPLRGPADWTQPKPNRISRLSVFLPSFRMPIHA